MTDKINLNQRQVTLLMANLLITKMTFSFPRILFKTSGNAAWIQAIYMSLFAVVIFWISTKMYRFSGNKSVLELSECIGKKPLKIAVSIVVSLILIVHISTEMRTFLESAKIILLPRTKVEYMLIFFGAAVLVGAYCGFNSLSTINALFFPFSLFFLAVLVLFLIPAYDFNNIFPLFGTGASNIFIAGIKDMHCFSDLLVLNLLLPYIGDIKLAKQGGFRAILIGGLALTLICLSYALTYPYPYSTEFLLIPYQLSRMVRAGEYFQRFEALFEFIWTLTHLLYSSVYVFVLCLVLQKAFNLRTGKSLLSGIVALLSLISFLPSTIVELLDTSTYAKMILAPIALFMPILFPVLYRLKTEEKEEAS